MSLEISIDKAAAKATVTFTCEVDLTHALRTERMVWYDVMKDGNLVMRFGKHEPNRAEQLAASIPGSQVKTVDEGNRGVVPPDEVEQHVLREAQTAFSDAVAAHSLPEHYVALERVRMEQELTAAEAKRGKRPSVKWSE